VDWWIHGLVDFWAATERWSHALEKLHLCRALSRADQAPDREGTHTHLVIEVDSKIESGKSVGW
jgi:hypothetical protein